MRYLTIALTKGRLAKKTLELSGAAGITCEEMKDHGSTKADFYRTRNTSSNFSWPKGPDVPTYVEYGAADIGIVGRGYDPRGTDGRSTRCWTWSSESAGCASAAPKRTRSFLKHQEFIRVATKYPNIARDYFLQQETSDRRDHQTERFHRAGSHRGPHRGHRGHRGDRFYLTGEWSSGAGGGLPPSARVVVNPVSMRMENERITQLV